MWPSAVPCGTASATFLPNGTKTHPKWTQKWSGRAPEVSKVIPATAFHQFFAGSYETLLFTVSWSHFGMLITWFRTFQLVIGKTLLFTCVWNHFGHQLTPKIDPKWSSKDKKGPNMESKGLQNRPQMTLKGQQGTQNDAKRAPKWSPSDTLAENYKTMLFTMFWSYFGNLS